MVEKVLRYIHKYGLIMPGDRVTVALSGGADSVALLRVLLELRNQLGMVLSASHFNHNIRGAEADADQQFARKLAEQFNLEFYLGSADVPAHARQSKISLEAAARELRHSWFAQLISGGKTDKIAIAHTLNDQAETVLMRILRGTGTRGLAGIASQTKGKGLIRPFLGLSREEVEKYLNSLSQPWREDSSNQDRSHTRNLLRHELLPLLQQEYNPVIKTILADLAEIARAEEEYWEKEVIDIRARLVRSGKPSRSGRALDKQDQILAIDLAGFQALSLALQRRLLHFVGTELEVNFEFKHVEELLELACQKKAGKRLELPSGLIASRLFRELQFRRKQDSGLPNAYQYSLKIPGEVAVPELGRVLRARLISAENKDSGYNNALLDRNLLAPEVVVRNWRPGDRYFPAHSRSPKKIKELLQAGRLGHALSPVERKLWPVIESSGQIVWLRGFPVPESVLFRSGQAVLIEELKIDHLG